MIKLKDGYAKLVGTSYNGNNNYVLLAGGSHKAISDFITTSIGSIGNKGTPIFSYDGQLQACHNISFVSNTVTGLGWYRIAESPLFVQNCNGIFIVEGSASGLHSAFTLSCSVSYDKQAEIMQISSIKYSIGNISKARIVYPQNYENNKAYLEIYVSATNATSIRIQSTKTNWQDLTPVLVSDAVDTSIYKIKEINLENLATVVSNLTSVGNINLNIHSSSALNSTNSIIYRNGNIETSKIGASYAGLGLYSSSSLFFRPNLSEGLATLNQSYGLEVTSTSLKPSANNTTDLGSSSNYFRNTYSDKFVFNNGDRIYSDLGTRNICMDVDNKIPLVIHGSDVVRGISFPDTTLGLSDRRWKVVYANSLNADSASYINGFNVYKTYITGTAMSAGWYRIAKLLAGDLSYFLCLLFISGSWYNSEPTTGIFTLGAVAGKCSILLLSGTQGIYSKIRLVFESSGIYYLEVYQKADSTNLHLKGFMICGNVVATVYSPTTPDGNEGSNTANNVEITVKNQRKYLAGVDGSTGNATTPVYSDSLGNLIACTSYANATVDNANKLGGVLATAYVKHRENDFDYTEIARKRWSGTAPGYVKIQLPFVASTWTMVAMELFVKQSYSPGYAGKIIIYAQHGSGNGNWYEFRASVSDFLTTAIKVHGLSNSSTHEFYIEGIGTYSSVVISKMSVNDTITNTDLSNVTISEVSAMPSNTAAATMYYDLHSGNYTDYTVTKTGGGASGTWGISISGTADLAKGLLGNGYTSGNSNIIKPFWNTKSDGRWYLLSADAAYQCRVSYSDNSDMLDGYHYNNLYTGTNDWMTKTGKTTSIEVAGESSKWYPVVISVSSAKSLPTKISVWKNLGSKTPSISGNHSNGTSSMWLLYEGRATSWDGDGGFYRTIYKSMPYANLCANARSNTNMTGSLIVWLRGGGCQYYVSCTNPFSVNIYYSNTNISGNATHTDYVDVMTSVSNGGIFGGITWYGTATSATTATTATTASQVTINYNNNSNSTYQMLWGSGNSIYGTAEIYCNPYTDTIYAKKFFANGSSPQLDINNKNDSTERSLYLRNASASWAITVNGWGVGNGVFAIGLFEGTFSSGSSRAMFTIDNHGYVYCKSYLNIGGHEKNNSSPTYVWGSNATDSYLRSYQTSALRVGYATNADWASCLHTKGTNTITNTTNDTTAKWGEHYTSIHYYTATGLLIDQPSQYGYILNVGSSSEVHQLWMTQSSGNMYHRGGNASGWNGTWRRIIDSVNISPTLNWTNATSASAGSTLSVTVGGVASSAITISTVRSSYVANMLAGFSSYSTSSQAWGNQTGTGIHCENDSTGGSFEFRRDNPSGGKVSLKVDGRFYFNEGNTPAAGLKSANGYWGMTGADGEDNVWIRTTTQGIIPYQSGGAGSGHQSLGTSTWYFSAAYIDHVYGTIDNAVNADKLDGLHLSNIIKWGHAYPYGGTSKVWHNVATFSLDVSSSQINTGIGLYVSQFYGGQARGILLIDARAETGDSTLSWLRIGWVTATGIDPNNFVGTYKKSGNIITIKLWCYCSGWNAYTFTKITEGAWTSNYNNWTLNDAYNGNSYTATALPSGETQVVSSLLPLNISNASLPYRLQERQTSNSSQVANPVSGFHYISYGQGEPFKSFHTSNVDFGMISYGYSDLWGMQIGLDFRTNHLAVRNKNNGTWNSWRLMHGLNEKISRAGGSYSWHSIQQYNSSDANPSYYSADCAIINLTSYSGWQPWIRAVDSEKGVWTIGNYTNELHIGRIPKTNTSSDLTYHWTFGATGYTTFPSGITVNGRTTTSQLTSSGNVKFTGLDAGSSDVTANTEILTSYASNNGFADTNGGPGTVYRRPASKIYNYVKNTASGTWNISISGNAATSSQSHKLTVWDARGRASTPSYYYYVSGSTDTTYAWEKCTVTSVFQMIGTPSSDWYSGLHVAGWSPGSYASWELYGPSSTSIAQDALYYRTGVSTWNSWRTLVSIAYNTGLGSATKPVYVGADGKLAVCNAYPAVPTVNNGALTLKAGTDTISSAFTSNGAAQTYTIPSATAGAFGVVKVASVKASAVTTNNADSGRYIGVNIDSSGKLYVGIPTYNNYSLPLATYNTRGGVKPWKSHTAASTGPTAATDATAVAVNTISTTAGRYYAIESDSDGRLFVNVPWTAGAAGNNYYPTELTWTNGTNNGPVGNLKGTATGMPNVTFNAIPAASGSYSGIVTTGTQTFAGAKTFSGAATFSSTVTVNNKLSVSGANYINMGGKDVINYNSGYNTLYIGRTTDAISTLQGKSIKLRYYDSNGVKILNRTDSNPDGDEKAAINNTGITSIAFYEYSDIRRKKNIIDLRKRNTDSVRFREFDWIDSGKHAFGVVAQEIEPYLPELVETDDNGYKSVNYIGLLILKVKLLEDKVRELEAKLNL